MSLKLFLNPTAGRGRAKKLLPRIVEIFERAGISVETNASTRRGELEARIKDACESGLTRLLVAGGDGSMHEATNGIMASGCDVALGLIPVGTGNDLAFAAGIPRDPLVAARALAARVAEGRLLKTIDVGACNGRWFANGAGIGIDARVAAHASTIRLPIGDLVYGYGVLRCLVEGIASPVMTVDVDGERAWSGRTTLANIANGCRIGGQFLIAPDASLSDGALDVVIAAAVSRRRVLSLIGPLMRGEHLSAPEISHCRGREILVRSEEPVVAHLDGELQAPSREFEIRILPGALSLL